MSLPPVARSTSRGGRGARGKPQREPENPAWSSSGSARQRSGSSGNSSTQPSPSPSPYAGGGGKATSASSSRGTSRNIGGGGMRGGASAAGGGSSGSRQLKPAPKKEVPVRLMFSSLFSLLHLDNGRSHLRMECCSGAVTFGWFADAGCCW